MSVVITVCQPMMRSGGAGGIAWRRGILLLSVPVTLLASCGANRSFVRYTDVTAPAPEDHWCPTNPKMPAGWERWRENEMDMPFVLDDAGVVTPAPKGPGVGIMRELVWPRLIKAHNVLTAVRARGLLIAKCIVTREGTLDDCCVVLGSRDVNGDLLRSLSKWRYEPASFRGKPVGVEYVVQVMLN